ncbi:OmpW/AlkL family protein [Ottowia thiooxydans]|uniref:OmpW/AlkL family protein n=1 Tax=Ottowia thiooxydans TaxID=219182 RepID=UPI00048AF383|nr:OmpW family outer membrane protein [Ottowia thiooxydans]
MKTFRKISHSLMAVVAVTAAGGAFAQSAGTFQVRLGAIHIAPSVSSGDLTAPSLPGSKIDVESATQLGGGITYMVTDNIAVDVPLALPFKHKIVGAGAVGGAGELGHTKSLPISVFGQYRFGAANAKFRPYIGGGLTYAKFFKETASNTLSSITGGSPSVPTSISIQSKLAPTVIIGMVYSINERWFIEAMIGKTFIKTTTTLSSGQTIDARLNPTTAALSVGYRF